MDRALFVAWRSRNDTCSRWGPVGRLERCADVYRFVYTRGAQTLEGFQPFPGMEDLHAIYESTELFPLFANRLPAPVRKEYEAFLTWAGFDPTDPPDPIALLGVTEGRRTTDPIEVFPCPTPSENGAYITKFFLHGLQRMDPDVHDRIATLQRGERLALMLDIMNPYDRNAVAVRTAGPQERMLIGYVPRYLAYDIRRLCCECEPDFIEVTVERVNPDAPLQHRLLCRMEACWPEGFRPCSGDEFQPLVSAPSTMG